MNQKVIPELTIHCGGEPDCLALAVINRQFKGAFRPAGNGWSFFTVRNDGFAK